MADDKTKENLIPRSEEMCLVQLFLQSCAAYNCVSELGELGAVQFRDLNPDKSESERKFAKDVRRCDEMESRLRFLEREIKKSDIPVQDSGEDPEAPSSHEIAGMEATVEKLEKDLREVNQDEETLKTDYAEVAELKHILRTTQQLFEENGSERQALDQLNQNAACRFDESGYPLEDESQLKLIAGVIQRERLPAFERLVWRACRGNVFLRQSDISKSLGDDGIPELQGERINKSVFVVFFQGAHLKSKVEKICEGFHATVHKCPSASRERREMCIGAMTRIEDIKSALGQTQDRRHRVLLAAGKDLCEWTRKAAKTKAIYRALNLLNSDVLQKCMIAECWCPVSDLDQVQEALQRGSDESESPVPPILNRLETTEEPPTFNRTSKYMRGFQNIVDSYGVGSYREINPAPYLMITFPFLFAVMFGDVGHGFILLAAGLLLVLMEKRIERARVNNEIFQILFSGRYVILLMGLFSLYTGLIYNEVFSKSVNLSGTSWSIPYSPRELHEMRGADSHVQVTLNPAESTGPYAFGVDPVWSLATNKLTFLNSMKMKAAVIIGVAQMAFGLALSYCNHRYFNSVTDIHYVFLPQAVFFSVIFVYLCVQIVVKWIFFGVQSGHVFGFEYPGAVCAPSLLHGLINMCMMKTRPSGFYGDDGKVLQQCQLSYWFPGQAFLEGVFIPTAVVCVLLLLFGKPYRLWRQRKQVGEKFNLGDTMVSQAIHTIEFTLGCISHTASYLRLWALSLAHAQLSEVLWTMLFRVGLRFSGYWAAITLYAFFLAYACLTFAILVVMEGLSSFLHALRLHWVEFQSKFFVGQGYAFVPFSFNTTPLDNEAKRTDEN